MAEAVYALCALASVACAVLLLRSYFSRGSRLLLWSSLCFVLLALNNILLFVDRVMVPEMDMAIVRSLVASAGLLVLLVGLVWEAR
jgi:hypothetical protein